MNALKRIYEKLSGDGDPGTGGPSPAALLLFAALLSGYAVTVTRPPSFDPKYAIYPDISCVYWIQALFDPGLFPQDPVSAFYRAHLGRFNPESLWVWITSLFMRTEPCTLGLKFLSALLCVWAAWLVRRLAESSPAKASAGAAALLFAPYFLSMDTFYGVPRSYGLLAFLGFALALEKRRFQLLPVYISLGFIFYPAVSVMLAASAVLAPFFFREEFREKGRLPRYLGALLAGALFCLLALSRSVALENTVHAFSSGDFQAAKLYQMVSAPLDIRHLPDLFLNFLLNVNEHGKLYAVFTCLLAAAGLFGALRARKLPALPRAVPVMLAGAAAAFLPLYFIHPVSASRQTTFIIPLALVFLAAQAAAGPERRRFKPAALAAFCAGLFMALHPLFNEVLSSRPYRPVYEYLGRLRGDAVVAAYPGGMLAGTVPIFSKKTAFLSDDFTDQHVLLLGSGEETRRRRKALLSALYGAGKDAAAELSERYGADYLVFEHGFYSAEFLAGIERSVFAADRELAALLEGGPDPAAFYLSEREKAVFVWSNKDSEGFVLDLRAPAGAGKPAAGAKKR